MEEVLGFFVLESRGTIRVSKIGEYEYLRIDWGVGANAEGLREDMRASCILYYYKSYSSLFKPCSESGSSKRANQLIAILKTPWKHTV